MPNELTTKEAYKHLSEAENSLRVAKTTPKCKDLKQREQLEAAAEFLTLASADFIGQKKLDDDAQRVIISELFNKMQTTWKGLTVPEIQMGIKSGLLKEERPYISAANLIKYVDNWRNTERPKLLIGLQNKKVKHIEQPKEWSTEQKKNYVAYQKKKHMAGKEAFYVRCYTLIDEVEPFTVEERKSAIDLAIKILRAEYVKAAGNPIMKSMLSEIKKAGEELKKGGKITNTKALAACKAACVIARWDNEKQ